MKTFKVTLMTTIFAAAITLATHSAQACGGGCGGDGESSMGNMSKEKREEMAAAHEKLAACLRTDSPMEKCHEAMMGSMMGSCGSHGEKGSCPMMSGKMSGKMGKMSAKKMDHKSHSEHEEKEGSEEKK